MSSKRTYELIYVLKPDAAENLQRVATPLVEQFRALADSGSSAVGSVPNRILEERIHHVS